jgi:V/A-type H+-transporting ATPase subunit E
MEVKLENLIEKIKKEGIEDGKAAGEEILADARKEAVALVEKAKADAAAHAAEAEKKAAQFRANAELAVKQAARDAELVLKDRLSELFNRVFKQKIESALAPELVAELIKTAVAQWKPGAEIEVTVAEGDRKKLEALLASGVKAEAAKGITLKPSSAFSGGFRISAKGENVVYDFTDETFAELLRGFVNPSLKKLLEG